MPIMRNMAIKMILKYFVRFSVLTLMIVTIQLLLTSTIENQASAMNATAPPPQQKILPGTFNRQARKKRIALVIGNSNYIHSPSLDNPVQDAELISNTLKSSGFEVIMQLDVGYKQMKRAIRKFASRLKSHEKNTVGLVYFAGHGTQVSGRNYLIPVDANITSEADVEIETIDAQGLLSALQHAGNELNIIILDACRNNPFKRGSRATVQGFARMDAPTGALLAYSTQPGNIAVDGDGRHSPYARALSQAMQKPGMMIEQVFKSVRNKVNSKTDGKQIPWEESSLFGDFYFKMPNEIVTPPTGFEDIQVSKEDSQQEKKGAAQVKDRAILLQAETSFWNSIKDSDQPAAFESYLKSFPKGVFAELAHLKLAKLTAQQKKKVAIAKTEAERCSRFRTAQRSDNKRHRTVPWAKSENCLVDYDADVPVRYCVSSVLPSQKGNHYGVASLLDDSNYTSWIESHRLDGIGEWILADFQGTRRITGFTIKNGYNKSKRTYFRNGRIKTVTLHFSDGSWQVVKITDKPGLQRVLLRKPVKARWMQMKILSAIRGTHYKDTCVNEFKILSTPVR